jgi:excisionase family DNA binding protein
VDVDIDEKLIKQMKTLDVYTFAFLLDLSPKTIYKWIKQGKVMAIRVEGRWRIPLAELERITGKEVIIAKSKKRD